MVSQMWPGRHLLLLVTLYTTIPKTVRAQTCYLPNGSVAYGDTPCSTGGGNTTCCAGACLANGLCFNPNVNLLSRSSCTDSTWTASECTSVCKTVNPTAFETVLPCGDNLFCCPSTAEASPDDCCSGNTFTLAAGDFVANAGSTLAATTGGISTIVSTITETITSTSSPGNTAFTSSTGTSRVTSTLSSATSANSLGLTAGSALSSSVSNSAVVTRKTCNEQTIAVGSSIGVSIGSALAIVSFLLHRARKRNSSSPSSTNPEADTRDSVALGAGNLKLRPSLGTMSSGGSRDYRKVPQTPVVPRRPDALDLPFTGPGIGVIGMERGGYGGVARPWVAEAVSPRSPVETGGRGYI